MKYKVFLIDDEIWIIRGLLRAIPWNKIGFEVVYYTTESSDVFEKITLLKPDIIISDIRMPIISGIDILQWCKSNHYNTKIILISAYEEFSYAYDALKYGAYDYIVKPIKHSNLIKVLERLKSELEMQQQDAYKDLEWKIVNHKLEMGPDKLFDQYGLKSKNEKYCIIGITKKIVSASKSMTVFSDILKMNKVILQSDKFIYFVLNLAAESLIKDKRIIENLKMYTIHIGISNTLEKDDLIYPEIKHAGCSAVQFLINEDQKVITYYQNLITMKNKNELLSLLQKAFAEHDAEKIVRYVTELHKSKMYNILDLINIGNYICINVPDKEIFDKYSILTLDQFLDQYNTVEEYIETLIYLIKQSYRMQISDQLNIEAVKDYLDSHYMNNIKIGELAGIFHADAGYMGRVFKKTYSQNMKDYIAEKKIERAKELLASTQMKIYEISEILGYTDYFYFARVFKKMTGETPNDYREKQEMEK